MKNHYAFARPRQIIAALSGSVALLLGAFSASAAEVRWSPATGIASDLDVFLGRSVEGAVNLGGATEVTTTVNGTTFQALNTTVGNRFTVGNFVLFAPAGFGSATGGGSLLPPFSNLSPGYQNLLAQGGGSPQPNAWQIGVSGLKKGQIYSFQAWANFSNPVLGATSRLTSGGQSVDLRYNPTDAAGALGEFATGVFVADTESQLFTISFVNNSAILSAFQLVAGGKVTYRGNYQQGKHDPLFIGLASPTNFDQLNVTGRANLDGTLEVGLFNDFKPKRGSKFTILTAGEKVYGEFDEVEAPVWDNLTLRAFYDKYRVYLKTVVASFEAAAETPNQRAVGQELDEVLYDERMESILHYLYKKDLKDLPEELDKIAPEELTSIFTISTSLANVQSINLQRRTDDLRHGVSGFSASGLAMQGSGPGYSGSLFGVAGPTGKETKDVVAPVPEEKKWGAFVTGVGEWVDVGGDGNARGYDITTGGFTLGLDYKVAPNFVVGVAAGYAGTGADLTGGGDVWVNGGKLGVYATFWKNTGGAAGPTGKEVKDVEMPVSLGGTWYVDAAVTGGYNSYDTKRAALQGTARGDTDGGELNVLVGTGYDWKVGALTIGPTATFQYTLVGIDGFTENGSLAPLTINGRNAESVRTQLGFKASYDWKVGGVLVRPEIRAAWQHEFGDSSYGLDASFANGAGNSFLVNGPEIGRDSVLVGAGVAIQCSERFSTYFYYDGELGRPNYDRHGVSGGVRVAF